MKRRLLRDDAKIRVFSSQVCNRLRTVSIGSES
jgi:hypothetical protein